MSRSVAERRTRGGKGRRGLPGSVAFKRECFFLPFEICESLARRSSLFRPRKTFRDFRFFSSFLRGTRSRGSARALSFSPRGRKHLDKLSHAERKRSAARTNAEKQRERERRRSIEKAAVASLVVARRPRLVLVLPLLALPPSRCCCSSPSPLQTQAHTLFHAPPSQFKTKNTFTGTENQKKNRSRIFLFASEKKNPSALSDLSRPPPQKPKTPCPPPPPPPPTGASPA